jgi:hypothetical protein
MPKRTTDPAGATSVRGKRANGAGSVHFDQANECYFATWRDADGSAVVGVGMGCRGAWLFPVQRVDDDLGAGVAGPDLRHCLGDSVEADRALDLRDDAA